VFNHPAAIGQRHSEVGDHAVDDRADIDRCRCVPARLDVRVFE